MLCTRVTGENDVGRRIKIKKSVFVLLSLLHRHFFFKLTDRKKTLYFMQLIKIVVPTYMYTKSLPHKINVNICLCHS